MHIARRVVQSWASAVPAMVVFGGILMVAACGQAASLVAPEDAANPPVSEPPANQRPIFMGTPAANAQEGATYSGQASARDPDGDTLTFNLVAGPAGMSASATGLVTWTPAAGQAGDHDVTLSVSDGALAAEQSWTITVAPLGAASSTTAPAISSAAPADAFVSQTWLYRVVAAGTPAPTISAAGLPSWLAFDGIDTLSGAPTGLDVGTTGIITVTASNGTSPDAIEYITIRVLAAVPPARFYPNGDVVPVDTACNMSMPGSIRVDASGTRQVLYRDTTSSELRYATDASGSWATRAYAAGAMPGYGAAVVLDAAGKAHACYGTNGNLMYATDANATGIWSEEAVDTGASGIAFKLDSKGYAHIAYAGTTNMMGVTNLAVRYATNAGGQWEAETAHILSGTNVDAGVSFIALALDGNDQPHLAYFVKSTPGFTPVYDMYYTAVGSFGWAPTSVTGSLQKNGISTAIAVDAAGAAHIAYFQENVGAQGDLKIATLVDHPVTGKWWDIQTIRGIGTPGSAYPGNPGAGHYVALVLDAAGMAHVAFYQASSAVAMYATNASGNWMYGTVFASSNSGYCPSITLDAAGKAHIAFFKGSVTAGGTLYWANIE